ncbi:MAG: endonuclease III [Blastocatellia bacterium]|nr:endonuclease III [Blastocatellia bacterium]
MIVSSMSKIEASSKITELVQRLRSRYPDATCSLNFNSAFELLIATILSAQCTDERVNQVTAKLFLKYRTVADFANASREELEQDVHSTGFYRNKAKNIQATAQKILDQFNGSVPETMDELLTLPGVARKTANLVLGTCFGIRSGVVVDTHVKRVSNRLGLTNSTNPEKIEKDLMQQIPEKDWIDFSHMLVLHGRQVCKALKPLCSECILADICPSQQS